MFSLKRTAFLIFFLFPFPALASNFSVQNWEENTNLLASGKSSEVWIKGKIVNLPKDQAMTSFGIAFDPRRKITINKVNCDGKEAEYSFLGNALSIKFPRAKTSNQSVLLYFSYREYYPEIHESLRQEIIDIPPFAVGANARVSLNFPGYMESATLNPNIFKSGNGFVYSNIVPEKGVEEIVKLTDAQKVWNLAIKIKASSQKSLGKFNLKIPHYFQSQRQLVENYSTLSSSIPLSEKSENGVRNLKLSSDGNEIIVESKAKITTGHNVRKKFERDPKKYLFISEQDSKMLSLLLSQIIKNPDYAALPLYAKIGKFVNEYLTYDLRYSEKLPPLKEILENRAGVCTEYSQLYNALARLAQIPSIIIEGAACGEYSDCRGHSWNMVYIGNEWLEVDPTWNLMSGIVSSSHVFFNEAGKGDAVVEYLKNNPIKLDIDLEMKELN